jgi:SAM-dependent methyltransferase
MPNVAVLTDERYWPLETGHVDRLIIMHGLETSDQPSQMLDEARRVLGPGGKVMFIVPNRGGIWSRSDATPMGFGRPFTLGQLETMLRVHGFSPENQNSALYLPPSHHRGWQKLGPALEEIGRKLPLFAGGVLMVEASKRIQQKTGTSVKASPRRALGVLGGLAKPAPKPVNNYTQSRDPRP